MSFLSAAMLVSMLSSEPTSPPAHTVESITQDKKKFDCMLSDVEMKWHKLEFTISGGRGYQRKDGSGYVQLRTTAQKFDLVSDQLGYLKQFQVFNLRNVDRSGRSAKAVFKQKKSNSSAELNYKIVDRERSFVNLLFYIRQKSSKVSAELIPLSGQCALTNIPQKPLTDDEIQQLSSKQ